MAASSTRSKPAAKKSASKAVSKPVAKRSPAAKPAKVSSKPAKVSSKPAKVSSKTAAKGAAKASSKAPAAKAAAKAPAKPSKAPAAKAAPKATPGKTATKPEAKPGKIAAKAEAKPEVKKAEPKVEVKPDSKASRTKVASKAEKPAEKPAKAATPPAAESRAKGPAKAPARKPAKAAPVEDEDDLDDGDDGHHAPAHHSSGHSSAHESRGQIDLADVIRMEPEAPPAPRKKSVLEVAEEDEEFEDEPPLPTADDVHGLLDRLRKAAQYGGDALEDLPRLIEQLEQIDDPVVMPRLLGLLEDNDPYGIYWNVLYVLEKFDDEYLKVLLEGIEALYARAPQWAYTTIIRILNTRGDEDDCTAAFERLVNASSAQTRTLVVQILRELAADPETDHEQKQNITRTITAIGGDAPATPAPTPATDSTDSAD